MNAKFLLNSYKPDSKGMSGFLNENENFKHKLYSIGTHMIILSTA